MNDQPAQNAAPNDAGRGVLCPKCDHLNPPASTACEYCRAALYEPCQNCGKTVRRTAYRCEFCGRRLRPKPTRHSRLWRQFFGGARRITLWQVALLVVAVYCAYRLALTLSQ